jgi:hypothetical protein
MGVRSGDDSNDGFMVIAIVVMIAFYTLMSDCYFVTDLVGFDDKIGETVIDLEGNDNHDNDDDNDDNDDDDDDVDDDDDEYLLSWLQLSSPLS